MPGPEGVAAMPPALGAGFGDFGGRIWLNCAHQGPLPLVAAEEAREAIAWKLSPHELTGERFAGVPRRLRQALGQLLGAPAEDIILANGASHGLHLFAAGLPLEAGDEVLLMAGDFPSNILPWSGRRERGVGVRLVRPRRFVLTPDEVRRALSPATRVLCMSWVHSFSGYTADLVAIGEICRRAGVLFLLNTTQGLGARPLPAPVGDLPVDGLSNAGWKWLCGPYGTGFCWLRPELRQRLRRPHTYWLALQTAEDLERGEGGGEQGRGEGGEESERGEPDVPEDLGARGLELFAPANFFNFKPWAAAVEHLLGLGLERIAAHDQALVDRLLAGLDRDRYRVTSPEGGAQRSTLVLLTCREPEKNRDVAARLRGAGVDVALRRGRIRIAPHLYNTEQDIDRALALLAA